MDKVIDFHATWCSPCKVQKPILEKVAKELGVEVEYVDIEEQPEMAAKYKVRSVPTMVILKDGEIKNTLVGFHKESMLKEKLLG
jgi:thioredoxin 1